MNNHPRSLYDICLRFIARCPHYNLAALPQNIYEDICRIMLSPILKYPPIYVRTITNVYQFLRDLVFAYPDNKHIQRYMPGTSTYYKYVEEFSYKYSDAICDLRWHNIELPTVYVKSQDCVYVLNDYVRMEESHFLFTNEPIKPQQICSNYIIFEHYFPSELINAWEHAGVITARMIAPAKN